MTNSLLSFAMAMSCLSNLYKLCSASRHRSIAMSPFLESLDLEASICSSSHQEVCPSSVKSRKSSCTPQVTQLCSSSVLNFSRSAHQLAEKNDEKDLVTENLSRWESLVDDSKLTSEEKRIHERHLDALWEGKRFYTDPRSGFRVITRLVHLQRGDCCGNGCRHCPYGHCNVPMHKKKKRYNSAFYV